MSDNKTCKDCPYSKRDWTNNINTDRYCANTDSDNYGWNVNMIVKCDIADIQDE